MTAIISYKRSGSNYTLEVIEYFLLKKILCYVEEKEMLGVLVKGMAGQLWYVQYI